MNDDAIPFRALTKVFALTASLGVMCVGCGPSTAADGASTSAALVAAHDTWGEAIAATPPEDEGCFHASYPSMTWEKVECAQAPSHPNPRPPAVSDGVHPDTAGGGLDYAAQSTGRITKSVGTFPKVTGINTESDDGNSNSYSIQLNSNFMSGTSACNGVAGCTSWSQFVYGTSDQAAYIQDWLVNYGSTCPSGWEDGGNGDCFQNSAEVPVAAFPISSLSTFKMSGSATGKKDSLVFTAAGEAHSTSQPDSIANLSTAWSASQYNVIGEGDGTDATFNKGTSITVKIALTDGSKIAPTCEAHGGTTAEQNNLTLGKCTAGSGTSPFIEFTETR